MDLEDTVVFYVIRNNERVEKTIRRGQVNAERLALMFKVRKKFFFYYLAISFSHTKVFKIQNFLLISFRLFHNLYT